MRSVIFVLVVAAIAALVSSAAAGSLQDVEHVVIFMQENRAFDHYYGTHSGVRGFNDRAAPPLPNGRPIWYQPSVSPGNSTSLCGCGSCVVDWSSSDSTVVTELMGMQCPVLKSDFAGASPPVEFVQGMSCDSVFKALEQTTYRGSKFADMLTHWTCAADLVVDEVNEVVAEDRMATEAGTADYILPFNLQFNKTAAQCMPAPSMGFDPDIPMFNGGLMDAWNTARDPGFGMAYFNRTDLPYYYALMDNFLVGDQYFQSTFTATNPNRLHLFSGSNGLSVPNSGFDALSDYEPLLGFNWETMGETLQNANISWKVIQEEDNFDDNAFAWFTKYRFSSPGNPLHDKGMADVDNIVDYFAGLVANDTLPQVSWIIAPTALSEHATNHPGDGEDLSHRLINVLADPANADVYAKTAFILNYDEGGQFFDHHWPPTPPVSAADGASTVTTVGELTLKEQFNQPPGSPIGLGFRVPFFIISPWTRGPVTFSEVADHTSVIQFIEERFGVHCPNISPWRRAVTSNLLAAFDFDHPDYSWPDNMPYTGDNVNQSKAECANLPAPTLPKTQSLASQEPGVRIARALPYKFLIHDSVASDGSITINMTNAGTAGAVFYVFNFMAPMAPPRKYTVEAGKYLTGTWAPIAGKYNLSLHGPDGFVRAFSGGATAAASPVRVALRYLETRGAVGLLGEAAMRCTMAVEDNAYGHEMESLEVSVRTNPTGNALDEAGGSVGLVRSVAGSGNWYDLTVTALDCGVEFTRRFMGKMETGKDTTTDPAMAVPPSAASLKQNHPDVPDSHRFVERWQPEKHCASRRSRHKDECWGFGAEKPEHYEL